jgi:hypothetical protein
MYILSNLKQILVITTLLNFPSKMTVLMKPFPFASAVDMELLNILRLHKLKIKQDNLINN